MIAGFNCNIFNNFRKLDQRTKETTLVYQIFGGYLQSQVKCLKCKNVSNTFDPMLDLSLDIRNVDSVEKALKFFTKTDMLTKGNQYKCEKCNVLVDAAKAFSIYEAPLVLTIQLKRFRFNGSKISKKIDFTENLDVSSFLSHKHRSVKYKLYGVIVHHGTTCYFGHYYAYVKSPSGIWYCMNDSSVNQASVSTVLKQDAYILMYIRDDSGVPSAAATAVPQHHEKTKQKDDKGDQIVKKELVLTKESDQIVPEMTSSTEDPSDWEVETIKADQKWQRSLLDSRLYSTAWTVKKTVQDVGGKQLDARTCSQFEVSDTRVSTNEEHVNVKWDDENTAKIEKLKKVIQKVKVS
jgi:hypothetical protein